MLPPAASVCFGLVLLLAMGSATAQNLPPEVDAALQRAKVPREAVTLLVQDAEGKSAPRLSHRANVPVNPASVMKLVTTYAALDLLGPAFTWSTPVYVEGAVRDGTLYGNLIIRGPWRVLASTLRHLHKRRAESSAVPGASCQSPRRDRPPAC